jgi:putative heme iron utilization protein
LTDISGAENLIAAEDSAVTHMNTDHADAVQLYATKLCGADDRKARSGQVESSKVENRPWRMTGIDPEGLDLARGDMTLRLPFPRRVTDAQQLRKVVVELAAKARAG